MVSTEKCLFFLSLLYSWEQVTECSPPSVEEGGLTSACRRGRIYIYHVESVRKIWLLNHFFTSAWTRVHLLYSLGYNPIPPYFLAQVVPALVPRSCCVPETCPSSCFFTTSFLSGSVRSTGSSCVFSAQPYNQPFLQEPWFIWGVFTLGNATQVFGTGTRWHHSCFRAFLTGSTGPRTLGHLRHVPPHVTCPLSSPNIQASYSIFCGHDCWSQRDF